MSLNQGQLQIARAHTGRLKVFAREAADPAIEQRIAALPQPAHLRQHFKMGMLPPDLQQILDEVDDADRTGDTISAEVTDEQFHWHPGGGTDWSIGQCLDHLAIINVVYTDAVREGVDLARQRGWVRRGPSRPGFVGALFIRSLEPPVRRRMPAPTGVQPFLGRSRDYILREYHNAHDRVRRLIADCAGIDTNRATFQNPFARMIRVKVSTGLRVIPAHDRRHLWQAEQVRLAPGFPRAT